MSPEAADAGTPPSAAEAAALVVAGAGFAAMLALFAGMSPLPQSFHFALAALVLFWGLSVLAHRHGGPFLATATRGAGALLAIGLLFPTLSANLSLMTAPMLLAVAGATLLQADSRREAGHVAITTVGAGLLLVGISLAWRAAEAFPEPARLRVALALAGALLLVGMVMRAAMRRSRASAFAPSPLGVFAGALLLSVYVAYRPLAAERVANLPLYEWSLAAGIAALLLGRLRRIARQTQTTEAWSSDARRHAQDVRPMYDPRMAPLAAVFERYLEHGQGYDDYRRTLERAHGAPLPPALTRTLEAARDHSGRLPKARREAAQARRAAHRAAFATFALPSPRGPTHGSPESRLRTNP